MCLKVFKSPNGGRRGEEEPFTTQPRAGGNGGLIDHPAFSALDLRGSDVKLESLLMKIPCTHDSLRMGQAFPGEDVGGARDGAGPLHPDFERAAGLSACVSGAPPAGGLHSASYHF